MENSENRIRGKRILGEVYDELPDVRLMTEEQRKNYLAMLKTISNIIINSSGGKIKGQIIFGTVGEDDVENLKQMFYDPKTYNIIDYPQEELARYFKPSYMENKEEYHQMKSDGIEMSIPGKTFNMGELQAEDINYFIKGGEVNTNDVSDGYHTFGELYEHRIELFIALCKQIEKANNLFQGQGFYENIIPVWMTNTHSDDSVWEGWFILGIETEKGKQITYHLPESKWEECKKLFKVIHRAPEWDGHTSADVLERLKNL